MAISMTNSFAKYRSISLPFGAPSVAELVTMMLFSETPITGEARLKVNVGYSYESCSFARQNMHWVFSQITGSSYSGGGSGLARMRASRGAGADRGL